MVLRRGWTLIGSHFLNALAGGSGGNIVFPKSSHRGGRAARCSHRLRNSVAKVPLGAGSLCSPGSKRSILGVLPPQLCIWDPSGTRYHYGPSLQRHLLVLNKGRGELSGGLHPGAPKIGTELIKPLTKRQQFFSTSVPATQLRVQKSAVKRPTPESCWQCQPRQPVRAGPGTQRGLRQGSGRA